MFDPRSVRRSFDGETAELVGTNTALLRLYYIAEEY